MLRPLHHRPTRYRPRGLRLADVRGHRVYARPTPDGADTLLAHLQPGDNSYTVIGDPNSVRFVHVRAVSRLGVEDTAPAASRLRRVAFDAAGNLVPPVPNPPYALTLSPRGGGEIVASWGYRLDGQEAPPASFHVFVATGVDAYDFDTPTQIVAAAGRSYTLSLGLFDDATIVRAVVRCVTAGGDAESNTVEATATSDATPPAPPTNLDAEVTP